MAPTTDQQPERMVNVRVEMPESLHDAVMYKSREQDRSMAAFIRNALREATGCYVNGSA